MKIGIISYPMLFQRGGGLQIQILQTIASLREKGIDVSLINPVSEKLSDFDLVHVFSAINGNHRIAEHLNAIGVPMVSSPLLRPYWNRNLGIKAKILDKLVYSLTRWTVRTEYYQINQFLQSSKVIYSLSEAEKNALVDAFSIDPKIIFSAPNGIEDRFFKADSELFKSRFGICEPYVLQVSSVNSHKNPLATAIACKKIGLTFVLIGPVANIDQSYLDQILELGNVRYCGALDYNDPLLPSAYAGAEAFCLPSLSEVSPLVTVESLAAGTPVVMTKHHAMDFGAEQQFIREVDPNSHQEIVAALSSLIAKKTDKVICSSTVERLRWCNTVETIIHGYKIALSVK